MIVLSAMIAAVSAPVTTEYDCQAEKQVSLSSNKGAWSSNAIDVEHSQRETFRWKFVVSQLDNGSTRVSHDAGILDALGLAGEYDATHLAPGQIAFATRKERNCMFTEQACTSLVEISDIDNRRASFSITPAGSVKMNDDRREIFQLVMLGICKKKEVGQ